MIIQARHDGSPGVSGLPRCLGLSPDTGQKRSHPSMARPTTSEVVALVILATMVMAAVYVLMFYIK